MKTDLHKTQSETAGTIEVPDRVFGMKWNPALVYQVVTAQSANQRQTLAHTKDRGEVRGGGKKPWRQKHTGRARHGSSRSPIWSGGGVTHGPRNERDFSKKINKKMKQAALYSLLSKKLKDHELFFVDTLKVDEPKTKLMSAFLRQFFKSMPSVLIVPGNAKTEMARAGKNISKVSVLPAESLNVHDCMERQYVLIEKEAVKDLAKSNA